MNLAQEAVASTGLQVIARVGSLVVSFLVLRVTTSYLGVDQFGQLAIVLTMGGLIATISDLGITTTLVREVAKAPEAADRVGGISLWLRLISSLAMVIGMLVLLPILPYTFETKAGLVLSLAGIACISIGAIPEAFFQVNQRFDLSGSLEILQKLLTLALTGVVVVLDLGFYPLVALLAAANVSRCFVAFKISRRFWRPNFHYDSARTKPLFQQSIGIGVISILGLLHYRCDTVLLSFLKPAEDVGIYALAYKFYDQAFVLSGFFMAAVFPMFARLYHEGDPRMQAAINRAFQVLVLGAVPVTLALFLLARPLARVVAGESFDAAVEPARILAFALVFAFVKPVFYNLLIAVNRQQALLAINMASLVLSILLNLILIPRYSYHGAAVATLLSEAVSCVGNVAIAKRSVGFQLELGFLARVAAATGVAALVASATWNQSAWLCFILTELTFLASAFGFRAVTTEGVSVLFRRSAKTGFPAEPA